MEDPPGTMALLRRCRGSASLIALCHVVYQEFHDAFTAKFGDLARSIMSGRRQSATHPESEKIRAYFLIDQLLFYVSGGRWNYPQYQMSMFLRNDLSR